MAPLWWVILSLQTRSVASGIPSFGCQIWFRCQFHSIFFLPAHPAGRCRNVFLLVRTGNKKASCLDWSSCLAVFTQDLGALCCWSCDFGLCFLLDTVVAVFRSKTMAETWSFVRGQPGNNYSRSDYCLRCSLVGLCCTSLGILFLVLSSQVQSLGR